MKRRHFNNKLKSTRIGETVRANNGMNMTIIKYRRYTDIDIQFEDGTILKHRNYKQFKNGLIRNPNVVSHHKVHTTHNKMLQTRMGVENVASNGLKMKIIAYRSAQDIDIQFEDGVIVQHKTWRRFISRNIKHPTKKAIYQYKDCKSIRIGEVALSIEGEQIELVEYNSYNDITIKFPDGYTISKVSYSRFKENKVSRYKRFELQHEERLGITNLMNNGLQATIIAYRSSTDIDVEFEDGIIIKNVYWHNFVKGCIRHPDYMHKSNIKIIGEIKQNNYGNTLKIIDYHNIKDITVKFEDDTILKHVNYYNFLEGSIKHPKDDSKNARLGEIRTANNGLKMEIIAYRSYEDIDVKFENNIVVEHKTYGAFKKGQIRCAVEKQVSKSRKQIKKKEHKNKGMSTYKKQKLCRIGESNIANNGMKMTIIEYRDSTDIDVQFEDGTIVKHKYYADFKTGLIGNPSIQPNRRIRREVKDVTNTAFLNAREKHIGEEIVARCGLKAKIIDYQSTCKITVQFEDGIIIEDISYSQFNKGSIKHPKFNTRKDFYANKRIGEVNTNTQGKQMKIIEYNDYNNITVEFEDGRIVENVKYYYFKSGNVK